MSNFRVLDEAVSFSVLCEEIASVLRRRGCDRALASQISRAADSVALNVSEARGFRGPRRVNHYRIALKANFICGALYKLTR